MPYWFRNPQTGEVAGGPDGVMDTRIQDWLSAGWVIERSGAAGTGADTRPTSSAAAGGPMIASELIPFYKDLEVAFRDREIDVSEYQAGINYLNSQNTATANNQNFALGAAGLIGQLQGPSGTAAHMELMRGSSGAGGMQSFQAIRGLAPSQYGEWNQEDLRPRNVRGWLNDAFSAAGLGGGGGAGAGVGGAAAGAGGADIGPGGSVSVNGQQVAGQGMPTATGGTFDPSITSPANKANPGIYQPYADAPPMGTYAYGAAAPSRGQMGAPDAESRDLTGYGYNRGEADDPIGNPRRYLETLGMDPIDNEGNLVGPTWDAYGRPVKPDNYTGYWPRMPQDEMESFYFEEWVKSGMEAMPAYEYPAPGESEPEFLERTRGTSKYPAWALERDAAQSAQAGQGTAVVPGAAQTAPNDPNSPTAPLQRNPGEGLEEYKARLRAHQATLTGDMPAAPAAPADPTASPWRPGAGGMNVPSDIQSQRKVTTPAAPSAAAKPVWRPSTLPTTQPNPALQQDPNKPTGDPFFDAPRTRPTYNVPQQPLPGRSGTNQPASSGSNTTPGTAGPRLQGNTPESRASGDVGGRDTDDEEERDERERARGGLDPIYRPKAALPGLPNPNPPGVPPDATATTGEINGGASQPIYEDPIGNVWTQEPDGSWVPYVDPTGPPPSNPNMGGNIEMARGGLNVVTKPTRFAHGGQKFLVGEGSKDELVAKTDDFVETIPLEQPGIPVPPAAAEAANAMVPGSPYVARGGHLPTPAWMKTAMAPDAGRMPAGVSPETGEPLFLELVTASGEPYQPQGTETPQPPRGQGAPVVAGLSPESSTPIPMAGGGLVDLKGDVTGKPPKPAKVPKPPKGGIPTPTVTPPAPVASAYALSPNATIYAANRPDNLGQLDAATQRHYAGVAAGAKGLKANWKPSVPKGKNAPIPGAEPVKPRYINDASQVEVPTGGSGFKKIPAFENVGLESQNHWAASAIRMLAQDEDAMTEFRAMLKAKGILPGTALAGFQAGLGTQQVPRWIRSRAY